MDYYTVTAERPDLAAVEVNPPEGYIGNQVMPISPVMEKGGTICYSTLTVDAAAQTSRTAGSAPDVTQMSNSETTYACLERIKRAGVTPDEAKQMGGVDKADASGSKWAKRQVMNAHETSVCAELLALAASATFDPAKILIQSQVALQAIRLYQGRTALVASTQTLKKMINAITADDVNGKLMSNVVTGNSPQVAVEGLNFQRRLEGLALFLGVDLVWPGDDAIWGTATYGPKFAMMKTVEADPLAHKWMPVFGRTFQFLPDGVQPWYMDSIGDRTLINNLYTAKQWFDTTALNTDAAYIFDGVV